MTEKGKKFVLSGKHIAVLSPYLAVFAGLYHFRNAWIAIGIYYAGISAAILLNDPKSLLRQSFRGFRFRWAYDACLLCFLVCPLILLRWPHTKLPEANLPALLRTYGLGRFSGILFALMGITINPLLEEGFWRGLFAPNPRRPALTDLLFAGFHFFILILAIDLLHAVSGTILLAFFSWAMRAIRARLDGLAVPILAHMAADIGIILALVILITQNR